MRPASRGGRRHHRRGARSRCRDACDGQHGARSHRKRVPRSCDFTQRHRLALTRRIACRAVSHGFRGVSAHRQSQVVGARLARGTAWSCDSPHAPPKAPPSCPAFRHSRRRRAQRGVGWSSASGVDNGFKQTRSSANLPVKKKLSLNSLDWAGTSLVPREE